MHLALESDVVQWCLVIAKLYEQWIFTGIKAVAESCRQLRPNTVVEDVETVTNQIAAASAVGATHI